MYLTFALETSLICVRLQISLISLFFFFLKSLLFFSRKIFFFLIKISLIFSHTISLIFFCVQMSLFSSNTNLSYFSFTNLSCSSCNKSILIFPCKSLLLLLYKSISISQMLPLGLQLAFNILCSILFRGKKENVLPLLLKRSIVDSSAVFLFIVKCTCREQPQYF